MPTTPEQVAAAYAAYTEQMRAQTEDGDGPDLALRAALSAAHASD